MEKKTFPMADVRKVIADETTAQFGAMIGILTSFSNGTLTVSTDEENPWERAEVKLHLQDDLYGENVSGYYISYSSRWQDALFAEKMSVIIGGVAMVAKAVEKMGVEPRK